MKKLSGIIFGLLLVLLPALAQTNVDYQRTEDIIYGRKYGMALTMDVFQPKDPNGVGIIMIVSGGWISSHEAINPVFMRAMLNRHYTVFAVVHGSQPKFTITEIIPDIHRAVRFIRHNASKYSVDPNRLGILGGSAGGHLSLTIGTQGQPGAPDAQDPVDRESSAVQCVACFFPPTDFLNYSKPGEDATGVGILKNFKAAFGARADHSSERQKLGREISPIYYIGTNLPPTLIIHGDADNLVPIQQSESFVAKARGMGLTAALVVKKGKGHGWIEWPTSDMETCADWFDEYLRGVKPVNPVWNQWPPKSPQ